MQQQDSTDRRGGRGVSPRTVLVAVDMVALTVAWFAAFLLVPLASGIRLPRAAVLTLGVAGVVAAVPVVRKAGHRGDDGGVDHRQDPR